MHRRYATVLTIVIAGVVTLSMAAPFAAAMGAGQHSAQQSIGADTTQLNSVGGQSQAAQSADTNSQATPIGSALQDANGTVDVLLVLDQASVDRGADREETIKTLKQHAASTQSSVMAGANELQGVKVTNRFWIANLVAATVDTNETSVQSLARIDGVNAVVKSRTLSLPDPPEDQPVRPAGDDAAAGSNEINTTYGLEQINATQTWNEFDTRGEGTKVAVLDTGVDIGHPDLDLYTENPDNETYPGGWAEFDENGNRVPGSEPRDTAYHGTHTSGTVSGGDASGQYIGVAPNVQLMHGLVIPGGSGTTTQVIAGAQWAVSEGADVTSLSLGAGCGLFGGPVYSQAWIPVIENAKASGTSFVASSGNAGEGCVGSPGNDFKTFSIGASNAQGDIASFSSGQVVDKSNWDDPPAEWPSTFIKPNVSAPGVAVTSADPDGNGYQNLSGTSMAAPHVAGAIALMHSANPDASVYEIQQALNKTAWRPATPTPPSDERDTRYGRKDTRYGMGIIDVYNATRQIAAAAPESELGDVNENGDVNVQDVRLMQQYLYGQEPANFNANLGDLNRDGEVTRTDLRLLQRKVQGTLDEGSIQVSNLTAPDTVNDTETINVTVDLENLGDEGAIQQISLHVAENGSDLGDGIPIENETVDMAPEGVDEPVDRPHETTVTFEVDADEIGAGEYHIGVFSEDDSARDEITIRGSNFAVSDLSAPSEVEQGDAFDVNATITNTGNQKDTRTVEYRFRGSVERTTNVTLAAGESTTVGFEDIETDGVSAGTYDHGVQTEDDSTTANITVLEGFFDVEITDAPDDLNPGETYNVTATVENTGNATDEQTVEYALEAGVTNVAVVESDEGYGDDIAATLRNELPSRYNITIVQDQNVMGQLDSHGTFVMQDVDPADLDVQAFVAATSGDDTGVVWLDAWGSSSDAIPELSDATGNPASTSDGDSGSTPVQYHITNASPIFDGVGEPGDTVPIHGANYADRSWFSDYSGQVIATVSSQGESPDGPAMAVDPANATVLASTLARETFVKNPDFTEAANTTLANSVVYASGNDPASTSVVAQDDTSENVTLAPGESETIAFTDTVPGDIDVSQEWLHAVTSADDDAEQSVDIEIERGAVAGTVTDTDGEPIEDATVNATVAIDDGNYTAVTGPDGEYRIEGVPTGTHNVTASADGYENTTAEVDVPANGTVTQNFTLDPMDGSISGTVTASDTGEPVANVTVAVEDNNGNVYEATTDDDGTYTLDVSPGNYVVNVADTPGDYRPQQVVTVAPGEAVTGVDFEVTPRNGSITGYVENAAGVPIEGAHVVDADQGAFNVTTDENGYYEITDLDRGTYALRAKADGYNATDISFVEVPANETATQNFTVGSFLAVSDLNAPDTTAQGETINVSATITNTGSEQTTRTVFYFPPGTDFGGNMLAASSHLSERVTLAGGENTTVTFTYEVSASREPGEYRHGVSADEVASTLITIEAAETPGEATYSISDLSAPATAEPGAEIPVNATITNTGNATGTGTVEYVFNATTQNTSAVTLAPGESTTVAFSPTVPATEGTYEHGIETADDSALANISVAAGEPEPAYFAISNLTGPAEVSQGESFTATATITNTGDEQGTQTIYPFLGQESALAQYDLGEIGTREMLATLRPQAAPQQVTLDGGESTTVSFTYEIAADKAPGNYSYVVSSLQEVASHPLTVTAANGSGQAAVPPAPVFDDDASPAPVFENGAPPAPVFADERADGTEHRRQAG